MEGGRLQEVVAQRCWTVSDLRNFHSSILFAPLTQKKETSNENTTRWNNIEMEMKYMDLNPWNPKTNTSTP